MLLHHAGQARGVSLARVSHEGEEIFSLSFLIADARVLILLLEAVALMRVSLVFIQNKILRYSPFIEIRSIHN
jgi:hypothetical protein